MAKYFKPSEFTACVPSCSIDNMNAGFLAQLDKVRELSGIPLVLNSAFRSLDWERKQGRTGSSSHCKGLAVDIRCNTSANRYKIVKAALAVGISRIGIGKTFVHLDADRDKVQGVIFDYYA